MSLQVPNGFVILPLQFALDELSPFLAISDNSHPQFYNLLDFPTTHFTYLTYDNHSIDKSHIRSPPIRPYAKQTHLQSSFDTTSDVSSQTIPPSSNVFMHTHPFGSTATKLLQNSPPPPPSINHVITTQPSTSRSPHQYNTPSQTTPPTIPSNNQPSLSQIHTKLRPIPLSFNNPIITQPQSYYSQSYFATFLP